MTGLWPLARPLADGNPAVHRLGETGYLDCLDRMRDFTDSRDEKTGDEIWLTSHPSVYTLGQSGKAEDLLRDNGIPLVRSDRGGQITYHGPGQVVAYILADLARLDYGVRTLVRRIEEATVGLLSEHSIAAGTRRGMPGVYVRGSGKIAALGLRVRRGRTYHGASLNVDCDLAPFADMRTCGYADLDDTSMSNEGAAAELGEVEVRWGLALADAIGARC